MTDVSAPETPDVPENETRDSDLPAGGSAGPEKLDVGSPTGRRTIADQAGVRKPEPGSEASPQTKETKAEAARRKYRLRVEGKEIEEELSDEEIVLRLQKAYGAERKFQSAAEERKRVEAALKSFKEDPAKAAKLLGVDLDEWAQRRLAERYEEELLPEHEREKRALQKQLEEYQRKEQEAQKAQEAQQRTALEQRVFEETERTFVGALEKLGFEKGLARTTLLPMMADIAEANLEYGIDLTPDQMASEVQRRLEYIHKRQLSTLRGGQLLDYLGDDLTKEVIRAALDRRKIAPPRKVESAPPPEDDEPRQPKKFLSPAEFRKKHSFFTE